MKLKNRVAVVTGGGSGIGAEICRSFAREGAIVAVTDIRINSAKKVVGEIKKLKNKASAYCLDVSNAGLMERIANQIEIDLGPIDIWVNNAGISRIVSFLDCTEDMWDLIIKVNLKGTFLGCKEAIRRMLKRRSGVILNMSSQSGKTGNSHYQAYCASKFGIIGLTQSLAVEFAKEGIRINALCPGVVFTSLWEDQILSYSKKKNIEPENIEEYFIDKIPIGRLCKPSDIAKTAIFLASSDASYITGQAINVSGGTIMH